MNTFSFYFKYFLASIIVFIATFFFIDQLLYKSALEAIISKQEQKLNLKTAYISNYFEPLFQDIELLANQTGLQYYLNEIENKSDLIKDYTLFEEINKSYTQIRIIDENGLENLRVNFFADSIEIVSDDLLQNKINRDYFLETIKLAKKQIYLSEIELNEEFEVIEIPFRPVLRVSKPLFDYEGNRKGIIITNYNAIFFLERFANYYQEEEEFFFLNDDGYFISAPEGYPLWGFMIPELITKNFGAYFPGVWAHINTNKNGHIINDNGLFVFKSITPANFELININANSIVTPNSWVMSTWIPVEEFNSLAYNHRYILISGLLALLILTCIGFYFLGRSRLALIKKDKQLSSANEILQTNQKELLQKNKELEQFVYITSHDLQEPLRTISSFSQILKEDYSNKLDGDGNRFLGYLFNSSERLLSLVKGILDYSKIEESGLKELIDTGKLINEILEDLNYSIDNKNAEIRVGTLPKIIGNRSKLRILFQNLISNALKFNREGISPKISISANESTDHWIFNITDNGIGINPKHINKIFNMFQRLNSQKEFEGNGIGLALCKKIVDFHNGTISVNSNVDEGSNFIIRLPKEVHG